VSDTSNGVGWWQAADGRWYPPQNLPPSPSFPSATPPPYAVPSIPNYGPTFAHPPPSPYPVPYGQPGMGLSPFVCFACGGMVVATASMCPRCGTLLGTPKDKTAAVLLAIFLAPWNWVYTYKRDSAKFWIGISVMVVGLILTFVGIGLLMIFGIWLWAVIDAATKPDAFYRQFPNGPG